MLTSVGIRASQEQIDEFRSRLTKLLEEFPESGCHPETPESGKTRSYRLTLAFFPLDK